VNRLEGFDDHIRPALRKEVLWLGRALLNMAKNRAENDDVTSESFLREGNVTDEIIRFLNERSATLLLLGASRESSTAYFGENSVEKFAQTIRENSGIPVEIVRAEPISSSAS
jgi:nucleotide-binding universal stress UspA family protein